MLRFVSDCVVLSLCSACGQLFIYHTISEFGPVVFIIIMTVRQLLAVVLSTIIYLHPLSALSVIGKSRAHISLFPMAVVHLLPTPAALSIKILLRARC
jgi:adenosine 3'-phospho 5'-phosphosulfate transporter B2